MYDTWSFAGNYSCTKEKSITFRLTLVYIRMLRAILKMSRKQHLTKQQRSGHLPSISQTIQLRQTRHMRHCWRRKNELISDVLQWTPTHGRVRVGRPAKTYVHQVCADIGFSLDDLSVAIDERDGWREKVMVTRSVNVTWLYIYIYIYILCRL